MRNWADVVPEGVAKRQHRWERGMRLLRMKEVGISNVEIAERCGMSEQTISEWMRSAEFKRHKPSPVEVYLGLTDTTTPFAEKAGGATFTFLGSTPA